MNLVSAKGGTHGTPGRGDHRMRQYCRPYAKNIVTYPHMELVGVTDLDVERATAFATEFNCRAYSSVVELLADDAIAAVVNLTIPHVHAAISTQALEAGKHVYSEKPMALTYADAQELV